MDSQSNKFESLATRLEEINKIENKHDRIKALLLIVPNLTNTQKEEVLTLSLDVARSIENSDYKARALIEVALYYVEPLKNDILMQAFDASRSISDAYYRTKVLLELAPHLHEFQLNALLKEALDTAVSIQDIESKVEVLCEITPHLAETKTIDVLEQALKEASAIDDKYEMVRALGTVASYIPSSAVELLQKITNTALSIEDGEARAYAIREISFYLPEPERYKILDQALDAAISINDEEEKAYTLIDIASALDKPSTNFLEKIINATKAITEQRLRADIFVRLAPNLPDKLVKDLKLSVDKDVWEEASNDFAQTTAGEAENNLVQPRAKPPLTDFIAQSFKNDTVQGDDLLGIKPEVHALAEALGMRALTPPLAVGILGGWGSGKSFVMNLMRQRLNTINQGNLSEEHTWGQKADATAGKPSPYVGHIYQIHFNSWTYAKADLWSSLMQTIFQEFNHQLTLERHLYNTFAIHDAVSHLIDKLASPAPEKITSEMTLELINWLSDNRPETDGLLQVLTPQFWENVENSCKNNLNKEKPLVWGNIAWSGLRQKLAHEMKINIAEKWELITYQEANEIWKLAQKGACRKVLSGGLIRRIITDDLTAFERDKAIQDEPLLGKLGLLIWQEIVAGSRNQGVIWKELSNLRRRDQQELTAIEKSLLSAEGTLENEKKLAKLNAQKKLERRQIAIIWQPILDRTYRLLRVNPEQIDSWKTSVKKMRQSPRAYVALFCLIILIIIGASPSWSQRMNVLEEIAQAYLNTAITWLVEIYKRCWPISLPLTIPLLQNILRIGRQYLNEVQQAQIKLESQYQDFLNEAQEEAQLSDCSQKVESLRLQVEQKRLQVGLVANQVSLLDFINNRLQDDSYKHRLGLIHQISRDLDDLSDRLVYRSQSLDPEDSQHIRNLFPRGPARVVLYIDDLDRCPPDRVVDVLEAVQLLLNTPLFIVVLAIDDRYIARSLETTYKGVLKRGGSPSGIDYLEKIIQIPYRTRSITGTAIENYLKNNIDIEEEENVPASLEEQSKDLRESDLENASIKTEIPQSSSLDEPSLEPPPPQVAKFTTSEFEILKDYFEIVDLSPRAAKRLINIYKILKILWFRSKSKRKRASETTRKAVLAILVLSGRYPIFMREGLTEISHSFKKEKNETTNQKTLRNCLYEALTHLQNIQDPHLRREISRFYQDVEIIIPDGLTLRQIGEWNFNLALSFCFVGDVGYDPEDYQANG